MTGRASLSAVALCAAVLASTVAGCGSRSSVPIQPTRTRLAVGTTSPAQVTPGPRLSASRPGTFVSQCACARSADIAQYSEADGRMLGVVAHVPLTAAGSVTGPRVGPDGSLWLTFGSGPTVRSPLPGGDPEPDSCTGSVVRLDPASGRVQPVITSPSSMRIFAATPNPVGTAVALVAGGCATSFFDVRLVIRDLRTGRQWPIGADAERCHALPSVSWSPDGSQLVFPYGPSIVSAAHPQSLPAGTCSQPRASGLVVVPSGHTTPLRAWKPIPPDHGCSYQAAAFDPRGIAAVESCTRGLLAGQTHFPEEGNAYLVQLGRDRRVVRRISLARGYDGGAVVTDPRTGTVFISEYQAANQGIPVYDWVWAFDGTSLRIVQRYPNRDAPTVIAEPW